MIRITADIHVEYNINEEFYGGDIALPPNKGINLESVKEQETLQIRGCIEDDIAPDCEIMKLNVNVSVKQE